MSEEDITKHQIRPRDFFSKDHTIPAIWGIVLLFVGFFGNQFWSAYNGPDEVVIKNVDQINRIVERPLQPTVAQLDPASKEELGQLRQALIDLKTASESQAENEAHRSDEYIKQLESRIDALRTQQEAGVQDVQVQSRPVEPPPVERDDSILPDDGPSYNELIDDWNRTRLVYRPKYKLPDVVKGYRRFAPRFLRNPKCPNKTLWESSYPNIGFRFADISEEQFISPLIVTIARINAPLELYQVFSEQYRLEPGNNSLELDANMQSGKYVLEFGYYVKRDVNEEFPKFYAFECKIEVIKRT